MKTKRLVIWMGAILAIFLFLTSVPAMAKTIKIGVLAPFKTPSGEDQLNAAKMAVEEVNAEGGINISTAPIATSMSSATPETNAPTSNGLMTQSICAP